MWHDWSRSCPATDTKWATTISQLRVGNQVTSVIYGHICTDPVPSTAPHFNKKNVFQEKDSYYKKKTVVRPSSLYNGDSYIGKTTSLHWNCPPGPWPHLFWQYWHWNRLPRVFSCMISMCLFMLSLRWKPLPQCLQKCLYSPWMYLWRRKRPLVRNDFPQMSQWNTWVVSCVQLMCSFRLRFSVNVRSQIWKK